MKGGTVQINWHDTKPVLSLDFHPKSSVLATGGADFDIKLWLIYSDNEKKLPTATYQTSLSYHGSAVNVVRFSPSGDQLASGADGGELIVWRLAATESGQMWKVQKTLSFHRKDVLDLQWSSDGTFLISGSVDNSCLIWDTNKGSVHQILDSHFHYVQGVAWDPLGKYVASLSSDRSCRIYVNKPQSKTKGSEKINFVSHHVIAKVETKIGDDQKASKNHLFLDETLPSFFRRLSWSPDGSFLLVPAGSYKLSSTPDPINTAYIFSRKDLSRPAIYLPSAGKPVIAVRFCPVTFCLRGSDQKDQLFQLPYRFIFAVATLNSVYVYDTESVPPIAILAGIHYAAITDISWSHSGNFLAISSQDGYCSLVEMEKEELGSPVASTGAIILGNSVSHRSQHIVKFAKSNFLPVSEKVGDAKNTDECLEKAGLTEAKPTQMECTSVIGLENVEKEDTPMHDAQVDCSNASVPVESKVETKSFIEKQAATSTTAVSSKPTKRRIVPVAINP